MLLYPDDNGIVHMKYRQRTASRPPPVFELWCMDSLARLTATTSVALAPSLRRRLLDNLQSMLLAEKLCPTLKNLAQFIRQFLQLAELAQGGQPILYKKRGSLSLLFDLSALQSEMSIDAPDNLVLGYTQMMMGFLLFHPAPVTIGMIGLGGGSLAKFCYRHLPEAAITVAEIDPRVIAMRNDFHLPPDDCRLQVQCCDGAAFVHDSATPFDILMVDGFDRNGQPPHLASEGFYDDCYQALAPGGILVVNLLSDAACADLYIDRLHTAFHDAVLAVDAFDSLNKIVFACKGDRLLDKDSALIERLRKYDVPTETMLRLVARNILQARKLGRHLPNYLLDAA